ncbi:3-dehydroecdysone 3alpha-reductase [Operophtera brumata]|uniref:3-dehydroecdysone 3alpha-reductase n=1 Tax=Operophtera brumata TaxID=104452 RepID=A0A0L7KSR6_OPEBR|nr:3-dehydroecdysone 3alpha-reductase [Operophtera brumata]
MSFDNKVVIVTGGSAGIGAAISVLFAKEGANVVIVGRNEEKLEDVAKRCLQVGKKALPMKADISKDEDVKQIIEKTIQEFGKIDVLINNAGILGKTQKVLDKNLIAVYDEVFNTNLRPVFLLTNLAAPYLVITKGNVVNISSIGGIRGAPGYAAYVSSKAAMTHFGTVAALELAEVGVRVNTVSPGPVETEIFAGRPDLSIELLKSTTAQNRISAPEEIAEVVAFIASDKAGSVTGSNYVIDCGYLVKK